MSDNVDSLFGEQYGITEPISIEPPSEQDIKSTEEMLSFLNASDIFESAKEEQLRRTVLAKVNTIIQDWVKEASRLQNKPAAMLNSYGGNIYTFGSYRLGVHGKGADIDTLCVVPSHISRETDFFGLLVDMLSKRPEITQLKPVVETFVPEIQMVFEGIHTDLAMAALNLATIPPTLDLSDNKLLRDLDPESIRSLNGRRVTDRILTLVPDVKVFRLALHAIKLWAKRRGIYNNAMGFLGGVSWAMLMARVCQFYPRACASTIVSKFMMVSANWKWPTPVILVNVENENFGNFTVWDPRFNQGDRRALMPIITPAFPSQNSTHNVSASTLSVMQNEFKRGMAATMEIDEGKATWSKLFEKSDFFSRYRHFLQIDAISETEEKYNKWIGLTEGRGLRYLVQGLERIPGVQVACPWPKGYERKLPPLPADPGMNEKAIDDTNGGERKITSNPDENNEGDNTTSESTTPKQERFCNSYFIGLQLEPGSTGSFDFYSVVKNVQDRLALQQGEDPNGTLAFAHVKRSIIPEFVFEAGEIRPVRKQKRKIVNSERKKKRQKSQELSGVESTDKVTLDTASEIATHTSNTDCAVNTSSYTKENKNEDSVFVKVEETGPTGDMSTQVNDVTVADASDGDDAASTKDTDTNGSEVVTTRRVEQDKNELTYKSSQFEPQSSGAVKKGGIKLRLK
eukprot:CFRG3912T1